MFDKLKSPLLLLVVLVLVSLSLAGGVFYLLQKESAKSATLQADLEDARIVQKATEEKLEESKKTANEIDAKLQEARAQIDKLNSALQQEKSLRQEAVTREEQLKTDFEEQKKLRSDLENKLTQAQRDMAKIQSQLKELAVKKDDLEKKIKSLEEKSASAESVELGTVVVTPEGATAPDAAKSSERKQSVKPAAAEGKVLVVNKDYNFAVINLGNKDGIELGAVFSVYRDKKYLGDVKVEKVHDSMSAAGFLSAGMQEKVSEGDKVVRKTK